jgi:hypothetical protein
VTDPKNFVLEPSVVLPANAGEVDAPILNLIAHLTIHFDDKRIIEYGMKAPLAALITPFIHQFTQAQKKLRS